MCRSFFSKEDNLEREKKKKLAVRERAGGSFNWISDCLGESWLKLYALYMDGRMGGLRGGCLQWVGQLVDITHLHQTAVEAQHQQCQSVIMGF